MYANGPTVLHRPFHAHYNLFYFIIVFKKQLFLTTVQHTHCKCKQKIANLTRVVFNYGNISCLGNQYKNALCTVFIRGYLHQTLMRSYCKLTRESLSAQMSHLSGKWHERMAGKSSYFFHYFIFWHFTLIMHKY